MNLQPCEVHNDDVIMLVLHVRLPTLATNHEVLILCDSFKYEFYPDVT